MTVDPTRIECDYCGTAARSPDASVTASWLLAAATSLTAKES